jgi:hypothetical protein
MTRWILASLGFLACHSDSTLSPDRAARSPAIAEGASGVEPGAIRWRVLDHAFVEDDAGHAPHEMWVKIQLEVEGHVVGPFTLDEPGCTLGSESTDPNVVSALSCYYAGGGDYVEIQAKGGEYVVLTYYQGEGSEVDDPAPPKTNMKTLGTFHVAHALSADAAALVAQDGGKYSPLQ